MAVLVRSGRQSIPPLRRSLGAAGVPVEVASDEVPLVRDPAALPLIDALRVVLNLDNDDPDHVDHIDAARAEALLTGPARRARRRRRTPPRPAAAPAREGRGRGRGPAPRPHSRELVRRAVLDPDGCSTASTAPRSTRARAVGRADRRHPRPARGRCDAPRSCSGALVRHAWPDAAAALGRARGRRRPPRAPRPRLDRARSSRRPPAPRRPATTSASREFLATLVAQQIPADTLAERGARGAAVRLLTAHRAKGLEWRLVVVAHVQQDGWPDLRRRSTLLGADRIGTDGLRARPPPPASCSSRSAGCSTSPAPGPASGWSSPRSRHPRTTATSPRGSSTSSASPSRRSPAARRARCRWAVWSASCVVRPPTPTTSPAAARGGRPPAGPARRRDRRRPAAGADGRPVDLVGHPRRPTRSVKPLRDPDQPVPISASLLDAIASARPSGSWPARPAASPGRTSRPTWARSCTRWPSGSPRASSSRRRRRCRPLMDHVDAVWDRMEFRTPWAKARELERVEAALGRFLHWHHANPRDPGRHRAGVPRRARPARRRAGAPDRLRRPARARRRRPGRRRRPQDQPHQADRQVVESNLQLGLYQLAVDHGAVDELVEAARPTRGRRRAGPARAHRRRRARRRPGPGACRPTTVPSAPRCAPGWRRPPQLLRASSSPPSPGQHCRDCSFVPICPIKSAGPVVAPVSRARPATIDSAEDLAAAMQAPLGGQRRSSGRRSRPRSSRPSSSPAPARARPR